MSHGSTKENTGDSHTVGKQGEMKQNPLERDLEMKDLKSVPSWATALLVVNYLE